MTCPGSHKVRAFIVIHFHLTREPGVSARFYLNGLLLLFFLKKEKSEIMLRRKKGMICVPFVYLLTPGDLLVRGIGVKGKYGMILALRPSQDRGMDRHVRKALRGLGGWGGGWGEAWRLGGDMEVAGRLMVCGVRRKTF